mgnify:CR=1 FL=1
MKRMMRRVVLGLVTGALIAGAAAGCTTQQKTDSTQTESASNSEKMYKIGITQISDHPSLDNCREGFIEGLKESGFEEGKNVEFEYVAAQGDMAMNTQIAQNFAADKKDLVCGIATPSAQALYAACYEQKIPVIFDAISDPVEAKLAKSETEAMDGITGISDRLPVKEQLELIREILPDAKKIGILYTTSEANSVSTIKTYKELAGQYGFEIVDTGITKQAEVAQAADNVLSKVDCLSNLTDNTVVSALAVVLEKANSKSIPVFGSEEEQVKNGCLASAGLDYFKLGVQAGQMAAKVLQGTDVSTIPFETLKESKITVNKKTAASLGITVPESVLSKAETVE